MDVAGGGRSASLKSDEIVMVCTVTITPVEPINMPETALSEGEGYVSMHSPFQSPGLREYHAAVTVLGDVCSDWSGAVGIKP